MLSGTLSQAVREPYEDDDIFVNCNWVVPRWQKYSTH